MAQFRLNKAALSKAKATLGTYRRFLPALEMKRAQILMAEREARSSLNQVTGEIEALNRRVADTLAMISGHPFKAEDLVRIKQVSIGEERVAGLILPTVEAIEIERQSYSPVMRPHWVDPLCATLAESLELAIKHDVQQQRCTQLSAALEKATQRVNLFEKILIPRTEDNIKVIATFIGEMEMAGLVRAKISQRKRREAIAL